MNARKQKMSKKITLFTIFLFSTFFIIMNSQKAQSKDVCTPTSISWQHEADTICPKVCTSPPYEGWGGSWSPKSSMKCGDNNKQGSVCGCTECVTVTVHPLHITGWWPVAWLTRCGADRETRVGFSASEDETVQIKPGSHFRIGQDGSSESPVDRDKGDTQADFLVSCSGNINGDYGYPTCVVGGFGKTKDSKSSKNQKK